MAWSAPVKDGALAGSWRRRQPDTHARDVGLLPRGKKSQRRRLRQPKVRAARCAHEVKRADAVARAVATIATASCVSLTKAADGGTLASDPVRR